MILGIRERRSTRRGDNNEPEDVKVVALLAVAEP
jgi:hypothetical protein